MIRKLLSVSALLLLVLGCSSNGGSVTDRPVDVGLVFPAIVQVGAEFSVSVRVVNSDERSLRYSFVFGDGTASIESARSSASHTFATEGTFQISVTVTDNFFSRRQVIAEVKIVPDIGDFTCGDVGNLCDRGFCDAGVCKMFACAGDRVCPEGQGCDRAQCTDKALILPDTEFFPDTNSLPNQPDIDSTIDVLDTTSANSNDSVTDTDDIGQPVFDLETDRSP